MEVLWWVLIPGCLQGKYQRRYMLWKEANGPKRAFSLPIHEETSELELWRNRVNLTERSL